MLSALRFELKTIKETRIDEDIYSEIWDSGLSSGKIGTLLTTDQVIKLTKIYRSIRELDIERKKIKQYREDYETTTLGREVIRQDLYKRRWRNWKVSHENHTAKINEKIERILQDKELWD